MTLPLPATCRHCRLWLQSPSPCRCCCCCSCSGPSPRSSGLAGLFLGPGRGSCPCPGPDLAHGLGLVALARRCCFHFRFRCRPDLRLSWTGPSCVAAAGSPPSPRPLPPAATCKVKGASSKRNDSFPFYQREVIKKKKYTNDQ